MEFALMAAEEGRIFEAVGALKTQVAGLSTKFEELRSTTLDEHRKVHDIVVATSESMRNLVRIVEEMKPPVDQYRLRAASIQEAVELTDDYKEERAEKRGADKFKNWIYGLAASVGGLIAIGVSKVIDRMLSPPHLPVVGFLVLAITLAAVAYAHAQEHHERHHAAHYQNWVNQQDKGCCNDQDCGELASDNERETAGGIEVRIEGRWCPVLPQHYLKRGNAPDWSTAHVCVSHPVYGEGSFVCERLLCYQPKPGI